MTSVTNKQTRITYRYEVDLTKKKVSRKLSFMSSSAILDVKIEKKNITNSTWSAKCLRQHSQACTGWKESIGQGSKLKGFLAHVYADLTDLS